ncbi:hypothetical protein Tsubulata_010219 [Turnera subulata]|uniref:CCHC-type domain-containing protein n=1 Tax=Turnera subulata TaxID=218843 RepID=A0A9Q0JMV8_9ROSI|nr:hypothetical protein Tsubulata_010219 [Turnera subulata]
MSSTSLAGTGESQPATTSQRPPPTHLSPEINMMETGSQEPTDLTDPAPTPMQQGKHAAVPRHANPASFKEKLMGQQQLVSEEAEDDFVLEAGDIKTFTAPEGPVIQISDRYRAKLHKKWENTLIVKLWGRNIGYRTLCSRLPNLWKLRGAVKVIDLDCNFYMVSFLNKADRLKVLTDGPWILLGHYLTVEAWRPQFDPAAHKVTTVVAWVQLPGLSCEYYDRPLLNAVCNEIGVMVRVDYNTDEALRGKFARVAIELDLSKPLQSKVCVAGKWYFVSYENLPDICFECGHVGHNLSTCPSRSLAAPLPLPSSAGPISHGASAVGEGITSNGTQQLGSALAPSGRVFGPWMVVQRRQRRPPKQPGETGPRKETTDLVQAKKSGSRYDVLMDYETVARPVENTKGKEVQIMPQSSANVNASTEGITLPRTGSAVPASSSTKAGGKQLRVVVIDGSYSDNTSPATPSFTKTSTTKPIQTHAQTSAGKITTGLRKLSTKQTPYSRVIIPDKHVTPTNNQYTSRVGFLDISFAGNPKPPEGSTIQNSDIRAVDASPGESMDMDSKDKEPLTNEASSATTGMGVARTNLQ